MYDICSSDNCSLTRDLARIELGVQIYTFGVNWVSQFLFIPLHYTHKNNKIWLSGFQKSAIHPSG